MNEVPYITVLTFFPLFGAIMVALLAGPTIAPRGFGIFFSLISLVSAIGLWARFDAANPELQFVERYTWIPSLGVEYFVGIDGLGLVMVALTALVVPFALLAADRDLVNRC